MSQEGIQVLGVRLPDKLKGPDLQKLGHTLQQLLGRGLSESLLQYGTGVLHTAVRHHLLGHTGLIKLIQNIGCLIRLQMLQLCNLKGQLLNIVLTQMLIDQGCFVRSH